MNITKCPSCGDKMVRNGKTKAGSQRWICKSCKATLTRKINNDAKLLKEFLDWLLSKKRQDDMSSSARTFRRKTAKFWSIWPLPPLVDEIHRVIYVDGIYLTRKVVILIARSDEYVLGWYLARSESSVSYKALLSRIAPPDMVVTDGGSGFAKACRKIWPDTRVQRCTFHAFCQVKRYTTTRPKLSAGIELYALAKDLLYIKTLHQATTWLEGYSAWCVRWAEFLAETTVIEGRKTLTHERLVKARNSLTTLINKGTLFTYLDLSLTTEGPLPSTNNKIEGGVNAPLRQMLREHRGMNLTRRIKAVFWWCYLHTECPLPPSEILKEMPTDDDIDILYQTYASKPQHEEPQKWGNGVVWSEFHHSTPFSTDYD